MLKEKVMAIRNWWLRSFLAIMLLGLLAAALIATLPVVLLFMLVQRFVVQGLTVGAVKG